VKLFRRRKGSQPDHPWRQCEPPVENLRAPAVWICPCGRRWKLSEHTSHLTSYFVWNEETP
jgi:hypothetical protein